MEFETKAALIEGSFGLKCTFREISVFLGQKLSASKCAWFISTVRSEERVKLDPNLKKATSEWLLSA